MAAQKPRLNKFNCTFSSADKYIKEDSDKLSIENGLGPNFGKEVSNGSFVLIGGNFSGRLVCSRSDGNALCGKAGR
jgi:hypothetical protein